jgi:hypothetical protein
VPTGTAVERAEGLLLPCRVSKSEVLKSFFLQLESSEAVSGSVVQALRTLLAADRLPKPEHLVAYTWRVAGIP